MRRLAWSLFGLLALAVAVACGGSDVGPADGSAEASLTLRDDGGGGVTLQATWVTGDHVAASDDLQRIAATYAGRDVALIHVKLDTHSVDLSDYDLAVLAELDAGGGPTVPLAYHPLSDEGHHREGVLAFPAPDSDGPVTFVVREVAGVPLRRLVWARVPAE